jgi:hypothetical protein
MSIHTPDYDEGIKTEVIDPSTILEIKLEAREDHESEIEEPSPSTSSNIGFNTAQDTSQSVAINLEIAEFGKLQYRVEPTEICTLSDKTGWHIKRKAGLMEIQIEASNLKPDESLRIRTVLVKKHQTYCSVSIDRICHKHQEEITTDQNHVLQAAPGYQFHYGKDGPRQSIIFPMKTREDGTIKGTIGVRWMCNDSCNTSADPTFTPTHASRDQYLILTLESRKHRSVLARRKILVWPKANVGSRDLHKKERRLPQGGLGHLLKKQKLATDARRRNEPNNPEGKIVNICIKVPIKGNTPTHEELLNAYLLTAAEQARQMNLEVTDITNRIENIMTQRE